MLFSWLKNRRRRKILAEPFPAAWDDVLRRNVGHLALLSDAERGKLRRATQIFIAEKGFEGCGGLPMTDEVRVTIAAEACIPVLGMGDFVFDNVQTVLIYPDRFVVPDERPIADNLVEAGETKTLGIAHYRGPVALGWKDALENARNPAHGENLVFHEFAHQLDVLNGAMDGTPTIDDERLRQRWADVMAGAYDRLCRAAERGKKTLLDPYGATNPAEFFAVVTECFFDLPWELERRYGELYALMRDYFCQDPARWPESPLAG
jgi:MtfA peptidase